MADDDSQALAIWTTDRTEAALAYHEDMRRLSSYLAAYATTSHFSQSQIDTLVAAYRGFNQLAGISEESFSARLTSDHDPIVVEMVYCRMIDAFLAFLTDLLALVYRHKPQVLRSGGEQIALDFALRFATMDDLVRAIAEQQVEKRGFLGLKDLADYFETRLKLPIFLNDFMQDETIQAVEVRNIIVHNHGNVSPTFKKRLPDYPARIGDRVRVDRTDLSLLDLRLSNYVLDLDERAVAKFNLPTRDLESPA